MILGRSTVQWTSLIAAAAVLVQVVVINVVPGVNAVLVGTLIGSISAFLNVFIAFLANTQTTPKNDPILPDGTTGKVEGTERTFTV